MLNNKSIIKLAHMPLNGEREMLRQTPTSHPDAANLNPNSEGGHEIEPTCREPIVGRARHSVRAAIDIQVSKPSQLSLTYCCFTFKKHIMQMTVCKSVTLAVKAPKMPGCVATGFPLPSTGRGIEGEGWSYPEPPPVSSCIRPTGVRVGITHNRHRAPQNSRNITFILFTL